MILLILFRERCIGVLDPGSFFFSAKMLGIRGDYYSITMEVTIKTNARLAVTVIFPWESYLPPILPCSFFQTFPLYITFFHVDSGRFFFLL